ncbi:SDR family NAD(P)-dependent oxidoreductase [Halalkalibacter sp. APA_J-10(15)]|uniref:SDR family NAD(P)-dependent oxidoreductase n=1 Tax=Halalkalibacter sp. APA_J-10(15) TaxID=2933805 RepID=UPI0027E51711|nr:SDR family NAD(P)-dependent oxidoreductase [Halalkalibacter sp. APA_J-10(15)]
MVASRNKERVDAAVSELIKATGNQHITGMVVDLVSFSSIHHFVSEFNQSDFPPLHSIICNAGIQFSKTETTVDGIEGTFGINHLGHFLLVRLLINQFQEQGSVIVVSSDTHDPSKKTGMPAPKYFHPSILADPQKSDKSLDIPSYMKGPTRYTTSKLCNLYFSYELTRRIEKAKLPITVKAFNPGFMPGKGSGLTRDYNFFVKFMWNNVFPLMRYFHPGIRTTKQSGKDLANLTVNNSFAGKSGKYWDGLKEIPSSKESYNKNRAEELWDWSSNVLGLEKQI